MSDDQGMSPFLSPVEGHRLDVVRVAIYARQSKARADASEASPEAQVTACIGAAQARSGNGAVWEVTEERIFKDVGRSGWDPNVIRPGFEDMMTAIRAGEIDVVIVNELSRLTRKGAHDALEIDKVFKAHGVRFVSAKEAFLDTSDPIGVAIFALIAALAKQDSDIKAERLKGAKDEIAAVGGWHSSQPPFGMKTQRVKKGPLTVSVLVPDDENPDHVETVKRMIEMSRDGVSDNKIATTFEAEGVKAPGEAEKRATEKRLASIKRRRVSGEDDVIRWRSQTVRWILNHPAIGGFAVERVKRGKAYENVIARDSTGKPLTPHTGIITGGEWLELQEHRKQRSKAQRKPGSANVNATLLSGWRFLTCGICGGSMGQSGTAYMCANPKGHGGLAIARPLVDEYVTRRVWARLTTADMADPADRAWVEAAAARYAAQRDLAGAQEERRETAAHLDHVRQSIKELQADRKAGLYKGRDELETWRATMTQYRAFEEECETRLGDLDRQTAESVRIPAEWHVEADDPIGEGSPWAGWDVFKRRAFLDLFLSGVTVGRGRDPETKKYVPIEDRVTLAWRELPAEDDDADAEATETELAAL